DGVDRDAQRLAGFGAADADRAGERVVMVRLILEQREELRHVAEAVAVGVERPDGEAFARLDLGDGLRVGGQGGGLVACDHFHRRPHTDCSRSIPVRSSRGGISGRASRYGTRMCGGSRSTDRTTRPTSSGVSFQLSSPPWSRFLIEPSERYVARTPW